MRSITQSVNQCAIRIRVNIRKMMIESTLGVTISVDGGASGWEKKPRNYNILPRIRTEFPHRQLSGQCYDNMASGGIECTGPR